MSVEPHESAGYSHAELTALADRILDDNGYFRNGQPKPSTPQELNEVYLQRQFERSMERRGFRGRSRRVG